MKSRIYYSVVIFAMTLIIGVALVACGTKILTGQEYLEGRGMSAIDIIGEAKYVYDMTYYTGDKVDVNDTIKDKEGKPYYRILEGELSTFKYGELKTHLSAYFSPKFINYLLNERIMADKDQNIYTIGYYEDSQISYVDYRIKDSSKRKILYEVTVFYDEKATDQKPKTFIVEQDCIDGNWLFVDPSDFDWGVSPI
ncbi:MAG: hypothetical protein RR131_09315 [Anaerovorax sp.]